MIFLLNEMIVIDQWDFFRNHEVSLGQKQKPNGLPRKMRLQRKLARPG